jgi:hypothetical protein
MEGKLLPPFGICLNNELAGCAGGAEARSRLFSIAPQVKARTVIHQFTPASPAPYADADGY